MRRRLLLLYGDMYLEEFNPFSGEECHIDIVNECHIVIVNEVLLISLIVSFLEYSKLWLLEYY